jgi:hypothetical protein
MSMKTGIAILLLVVMGVSFAPASPAHAQQEVGPSQQGQAQPGAGYVVGSVAATTLNIPMKTGLCLSSIAVGSAFFILTLGTAGRETAGLIKEGCGGPYIITPEQLKGEGGAKPRY